MTTIPEATPVPVTHRRVRVLLRRRDYLREVIARGQGNSYDAAEESALTWALEQLCTSPPAVLATGGPLPKDARPWSTAGSVCPPPLTPAPTAEGDVREAVSRVVLEHTITRATPLLWCLCGRGGMTRTAHAKHVAEAVLASCLVVPVGDVERLREQVDGLTRLLAEMQPGRTLDLAAQRDVARAERDDVLDEMQRVLAERDDALAKVGAVRATLGRDSFGVLVPGARERDPSHNGSHDVVRVDVIRSALDATAAPASLPRPASCGARICTADQQGPHRHEDGVVTFEPAPSSLPARLLSGEHVGREVVLPDGSRGELVTVGPTIRSVVLDAGGDPLDRFLVPDDVVTLVAETESDHG